MRGRASGTAIGIRQPGRPDEHSRGEEATMRAVLLGLASGLGTMAWLASLAIVLWRIPLGVAVDYVVLLIVVCALPVSLLVGATVYSYADPRGRGPTDAPFVRSQRSRRFYLHDDFY
jgi:hypothetical protein